MKPIYLAGPYGADQEYDHVSKNIATARLYARRLAESHVWFYCPHTHTGHFEVYGVPETFYQALHDYYLDACSAILMLPGWLGSKGSRYENARAIDMGLKVFEEDLIGAIRWWRKRYLSE